MLGHVEGRIEPGPKVPIGQEVEPPHRPEVRQTPGPCRLELQEPQEQHRNQAWPNLNLDGVLARADKGLDLQSLLEPLKEQLNLPALLVDLGHGAGREVRAIREEDQLLRLRGIPEDDAPPGHRVALGGMLAGQLNHLLGPDGISAGHQPPLE